MGSQSPRVSSTSPSPTINAADVIRPAVARSLNERAPGFDRLRAIATLLVVVLHAAIPYAATPLPGLVWPVRHPKPEPLVDWVMWPLACVLMPLFLVLSGYGSMLVLRQKGLAEFLVNRRKRLLYPLLASAAVILPLEFYVWVGAWVWNGEVPAVKLRSLKLDGPHAGIWGLSHLWYLQYVLLYCAGLAGLDWLTGRSLPPGETSNHGPSRRTLSVSERLFGHPVAIVVPVMLCLVWSPETVVGFQHAFLPVAGKFVFSGLFFGWGVLLARGDAGWSRDPRTPWVAGLVAASLWPLALREIRLHASLGTAGHERWLVAGVLAGFVVAAVASAWSLARQSQQPLGPSLLAIVRCSFWMYLVHHPLVAILQVGAHAVQSSAGALCLAVSLLGVAGSWASFQYLVAGGWVERLLDGRWPLRASGVHRSRDMGSPDELGQRRAA